MRIWNGERVLSSTLTHAQIQQYKNFVRHIAGHRKTHSLFWVEATSKILPTWNPSFGSNWVESSWSLFCSFFFLRSTWTLFLTQHTENGEEFCASHFCNIWNCSIFTQSTLTHSGNNTSSKSRISDPWSALMRVPSFDRIEDFVFLLFLSPSLNS